MLTIVDVEEFPQQFARTRRFSLGVPRDFFLSADGERVLYIRSRSGSDGAHVLWLYENENERVLLDPTVFGMESGTGVASFAADQQGKVVAVTIDGMLWIVRTDRGAPVQIPTDGPVLDPRPSPDGSLVAYVTNGTLRVVSTNGTDDRPLAVPESEAVTYGLTDYIAAMSIGRRQGYWWSPDSDMLLVARVDAANVQCWYVSDPSNPAEPPRSIRCPTAGTANVQTTLLLVTITGVHTTVHLPHKRETNDILAGAWGPEFEYLVSGQWQGNGPIVSLQTRDQRTVWILRVNSGSGEVERLAELNDDDWVDVLRGPLHTASGIPILPRVYGDVRTIQIGSELAPVGWHVREVLSVAGGWVLFSASEDPTEVHVWSYRAESGFERLTFEPGVHTATAAGDTLVLESRTLGSHSVHVIRNGKKVGQIAVLREEPIISFHPVYMVLGGRKLRSRMHLPSWYEPDSGKLPVLLSPYAGPALQVVTKEYTWHTAVCQWFAEQGFVVLVTDGRGTPGRGIRWERAIRGDRLEPVLNDQIDALHAAADQCDAIDLERVGIRGWSFSGYLAIGAVLKRPDVFRAAFAGAAPTDRRLYHTYWEERFLGHPALEPELYERNSLLPYAEKLIRPLVLAHGLLDDNVALIHTLRLSEALFQAGRAHNVLLLPEVGHMVTKVGVADKLLKVELDFFRRSLNASSREITSR